jgi:hypothetical protein
MMRRGRADADATTAGRSLRTGREVERLSLREWLPLILFLTLAFLSLVGGIVMIFWLGVGSECARL